MSLEGPDICGSNGYLCGRKCYLGASLGHPHQRGQQIYRGYMLYCIITTNPAGVVTPDRPAALGMSGGESVPWLLGMSCRHILIRPQEGNLNYSYHPSAPAKDVLFFGKRAYADVVDSIKLTIAGHRISAKRWRKQIEGSKEREKGNDTADVLKARVVGLRPRGYWTRWRSVHEQRFKEDWGIIVLDPTKLGDGFQGKKMDLDRLLPLKGVITDDLMHTPDMWDSDGKPCLLVTKRGNTTGTTLGPANGTFSVVRDCFSDMSINQTSMEWGIINYNSRSDVFSEPGDSGSIIADIRSSSVSRPAGSPTPTSTLSPRHLGINKDRCSGSIRLSDMVRWFRIVDQGIDRGEQHTSVGLFGHDESCLYQI
ncbi:hypothetical protein JAAARDRAFT_47827 [Jaapia argillacea MUCL 33604]|uniref:Uncharacterized protein n=1 Tax=Jaapia argillacea MUCL 33604 TaxID=933084 RepID=A0A067PQW9_9AGAM|nr:hypothetical protein JAAARDRAFT_47827 [Jaapia argillacea MUCL 33604]